jgi:chemotaxis protein MotB
MARGKQQPVPVVVRRRTLAEDEDHESAGTWKIAYADFVTAMMAFFLLMWLINVTTQEQREGISDYFNPVAVSQERSGADGMLSGRTVDEEGALTSPSGQGEATLPVASPPVVASLGEDDREPAGRPDPMPHPEGSPGVLRDLLSGALLGAPAGAPDAEYEAFLRQRAEALEEQRAFERVEREIRAALASMPELGPLADSMVIQQVPEGLRIQITDHPHFSMFAVGSAGMNEQGRRLVHVVAGVLVDVPNGIAITGHTDALAYSTDGRYGNWELSSDRANAARRELLAAGLAPARIVRVEGRADLDHLIGEDPLDPRNRRISITLMRRTPMPAMPGGRAG